MDGDAIILVGGKSSRMGKPKALLLFDGEPLIAHITRALRSLFAEVIVVAAPGQELPTLPVTLVRDDLPFQGPVGGIYYGLRTASRDFAFVTSCDAPFLNLPLVSHLTSQIANYDVVVPVWEQRLQPLHALYRKSVTPFLRDQLERGELRPIFVYDKVPTLKVEEGKIRDFDPQGLSFLNMNTPEDYEIALALWKKKNCLSVSVTVELFGVARLLAKTREVPLSLPRGATLSHLYMALAQEHPILLGKVIALDKGNLASGYACNINGLDFVRNPSIEVNSGDRIFILSADAGG